MESCWIMKKMVLPTIALRGMTVLPDMVIHFDINRKKSISIEKIPKFARY